MGSINIEHIHPLESGFLRLKFRRDRRPGFARESIWSFYPKYFAEIGSKLVRWTWLYFKLRRIYLAIKHDPNRYAYTDTAMTAVADDEAATHELFNTDAARAYIAQGKRVKQMQEGHGHELGHELGQDLGGDHALVPGQARDQARDHGLPAFVSPACPARYR